jgi:hypothetical protein
MVAIARIPIWTMTMADHHSPPATPDNNPLARLCSLLVDWETQQALIEAELAAAIFEDSLRGLVMEITADDDPVEEPGFTP